MHDHQKVTVEEGAGASVILASFVSHTLLEPVLALWTTSILPLPMSSDTSKKGSWK